MGLLFERYASPLLFMDQMLSLNRLSEFVDEIVISDNDRKMWELYLAIVSNPAADVGSFEDFKERNTRTVEVVSDKKLEATVRSSMDILQDFNPTGGGEVT